MVPTLGMAGAAREGLKGATKPATAIGEIARANAGRITSGASVVATRFTGLSLLESGSGLTFLSVTLEGPAIAFPLELEASVWLSSKLEAGAAPACKGEAESARFGRGDAVGIAELEAAFARELET